MFSSNQFEPLLKEIMDRFSSGGRMKGGNKNSGNGYSNNSSSQQGSHIQITPSQALVIAGILGGVLQVDSLLMDRKQAIEIRLVGSLHQKTELEKNLDGLGKASVDEVLQALISRFVE